MQGINADRVTGWMVDNIAGSAAPFVFELIVGGRSNLTFKVTDGDGAQYVLRRPPLGNVLATAHDMAREHRIISAVGRSDVPVAPALGLCTDESVNDAPFYVMAFVGGDVLDSPEKAAALATSELRHAASADLVDVHARLHAVDVDEVGLGDLARRDGYVERQIRRWATQWEKSKTRELSAVDEVARRLAADIPLQQGVAIAHGDYRFGNCLIDVTTGRVNAVLDWELCTLGDPLADLGYLGVYWTDPSRPGQITDPTGAGGFPSFDEVVQMYASKTGRDVSRIDYYVAFSSFRLAVISEGVYSRYLNGVMGDDVDPEVLSMFKDGAEDLAGKALAAIGGGT